MGITASQELSEERMSLLPAYRLYTSMREKGHDIAETLAKDNFGDYMIRSVLAINQDPKHHVSSIFGEYHHDVLKAIFKRKIGAAH